MKHLIKLMLLAIVSVSFCACNNEDDPGEYIDGSPVPYGFMLEVTDQEGNYFLTKDNYKLLEGKVKVTFQGTDYVLYDYHKDKNQNNDELTTQAKIDYDAELMRGFLVAEFYKGSGTAFMLYFGDFNPWRVFKNESITITWPDGEVDNIIFSKDYAKSIEQSKTNGVKNKDCCRVFLKKDYKAWNLGF